MRGQSEAGRAAAAGLMQTAGVCFSNRAVGNAVTWGGKSPPQAPVRSEGIWIQGRESGCWCSFGTGTSLFC